MYIFPFTRIRYLKTITINTHIDCANNSKCSVGDILLATKQGAFESVFGTLSVTFLNGDLEHEIYMMIPEGYDEVINPRVDKEDWLILQKAMYGLVQAARHFSKEIVDKMQEGGFKLSEA